MKHVHRVRRPSGAVHLYLRHPACPRIRLPQDLAPAQLQAHVAALVARHAGAPPAGPGTLRAALRAYELQDPAFQVLAPSTKYEYRLILKELDADLGGVAIAAFSAAYLERLRNAWATRGHRAANVRLQVLKNVLRPCLVSGALRSDPFPLVRNVPRPRMLGEPHRLWPDAALQAVLEAGVARARHGLARAVALARYTGLRRGDLVRLTPGHRQDGRIVVRTGKRQVQIDIPEDPRLTAWLTRIPDRPAPHPLRARPEASGPPARLVFNMAGAPYTEDGLGQEVVKFVQQLHREGVLDQPDYDLHGLRHTRGVELALAGCSDAEGAAMLGHRSASSFARYRRQAEKSRLTETAAARLQAYCARLAAGAP
ncbi:tyrosine-type recombinase/integrase [Phenylobacterium sp.]|uniref:tyrosine-type recombinase/integrase n=1 Tax=Phenylobacterium sp. TaxID=1871053 RepID=UPI0035AD973D